MRRILTGNLNRQAQVAVIVYCALVSIAGQFVLMNREALPEEEDPNNQRYCRFFRMEAGAGITFYYNGLVDTVKYDRLTFQLNGGRQGGQVFEFSKAYRDGTTNFGPRNTVPTLPAGESITVVIPLVRSSIGLRSNRVCFWMQQEKGSSDKPFFVTDMHLLRVGEAAP